MPDVTHTSSIRGPALSIQGRELGNAAGGAAAGCHDYLVIHGMDFSDRWLIMSSGTLRQANFSSSGVYYNAPSGSLLSHNGKINAAATEGYGILAQRVSTSNGTIADWVLVNGNTALSTLITD